MSSDNQIILIDGPSGAGKSSLADALIAGWRAPDAPQLVRLDDLYPGWQGLAAAGRRVQHELLEPLAAGLPAGWRRFDWASGEVAEWHPVDADRPLLIEGCGVLTRANAALADARIWIDAPDDIRKARALARDGETYAPHWDEWEEQWRRFVETERPRQLADLVLDGS